MDQQTTINVPEFHAYSMQHWIPLVLAIITGYLLIKYGKTLQSEKNKTKLGLLISLIPFFCVTGRMSILTLQGLFSWQEDLPLFLCRIIALMGPIVFYFRNRRWLGIFYFWVLAGTMNAVLTPDLLEGFPHWEYVVYWIYHTTLIIMVFYAVFVYGVFIKWKDYKNAVVITVAFSGFTYLVNLVLGSNYSYLMEKPPFASLLDYLGPWPWYIFSVYGIMFVLFFIVFIPFLIKERKINYLEHKEQSLHQS